MLVNTLVFMAPLLRDLKLTLTIYHPLSILIISLMLANARKKSTDILINVASALQHIPPRTIQHSNLSLD